MVCAAVATAALGGCTPVPVVPPDGNVEFRDEFGSSQLSAGWTFDGRDAAMVSLATRPGFVRIGVQAPDTSTEEVEFTALLRSTSGDFIIETRMEFEPEADRQLAGLLVRGDDGRTVSFGIISASFPQGIFRGLSAVSERAGGQDPLTSFRALDGNSVYLRLERSGGQVSFLYGTDGVTFFNMANHDVGLSDAVDVGIGNLVRDNCEASCDAGSLADFDFFEISRPGDGTS